MAGATSVARDQALATPAEVRSAVLAAIQPLAPRPVKLAEAAGLVLAEPLVAPFALPPFDNAAMDGFALRSADTRDAPRTLRVVGAALAGRPATVRVAAGEAAWIATGAMLPAGADAVVPVEDATVAGEGAVVEGAIEPGQHVRKAGEDIRQGTVVLEAGTILGPGQLAAAAAFGRDELLVIPRPRVAIVPTGDELRHAGEGLGPGQIYDSVSTPLSALIAEAGPVPVVRPVAPDDEGALLEAVRGAAEVADAVLTVGGVSIGQRDLVRSLREGAHVTTFGVALRPARPFAFGRAFGVPLFGLPGNPAAALAAFEELVRPALLALMGKRPDVRPTVPATLTEGLSQMPGRLHLVRVEVWREEDGLRTRPAGKQGAGMIHSLARAQGWAVVPPEVGELPAGSVVEVRLLVDVR
jgi:molybdopterin molybdotransferase